MGEKKKKKGNPCHLTTILQTQIWMKDEVWFIQAVLWSIFKWINITSVPEKRQVLKGSIYSLMKSVIVKVMNLSFICTYSVFVLGSTPDFICASLHLEDNWLHSVSRHREFYSKLNWNIVLFLVNSIRIFSEGLLNNHQSSQTSSVLHCTNKHSYGRPTRPTTKQTSSEGMTWSMDIWWLNVMAWLKEHQSVKMWLHKNETQKHGGTFLCGFQYKTRCICS